MASILSECGDDDAYFGNHENRASFDPVFYVLLRERLRLLEAGLDPEEGQPTQAAWQRWLDQRDRLANSLVIKPKPIPTEAP